MRNKNFKENVLKLISKNKLEEAIESCMEQFDSEGTHYDQIVMISGNLYKWKVEDRMGLKPGDTILNKIRLSIIELVNDYILFNPQETNIDRVDLAKMDEPKFTHREIASNNKKDFQAIIKEKARIEYPNDFEMQKYTIEQQMKAFRKLKRNRPSDIPEDIFESIRVKAQTEYPDDFEMRKYTEDKQIESFRKLKSIKPIDIPDNIFKIILDKSILEYPTDYEMQEYTINQQIKAYREIQ